jgi:2'-5' RNA ligase
MSERRSAVIAAVPAAAAAVDRWREETCTVGPSRGVPPHVTVLVPFVPPERIDEAVLRDLEALVGSFPPFSLELRELRRFRGVLHAAPEPAEPFVALTNAVVAAFPAHPPYEGAFDDVVPHLTVAEGLPDVLAAAEADVRGSLPIRAAVTELELVAEREPGGAWELLARLPLGGRSGISPYSVRP